MSEDVPVQRLKGYPSGPITKAIEELLLLKPNDPFKFLARYFQHISYKSEVVFLSYQILTKDFSCLDSAIGEAFMLLSRDSLSGIHIKDVHGLCSYFHTCDKNSSVNTCQKYLGYIYKQYSSKSYVDYPGFRIITEFHCILNNLGQSLNEIFKSKPIISGQEFKNLLLKYEKFTVGHVLLRIPVSSYDNFNQNQLFDRINRILRE